MASGGEEKEDPMRPASELYMTKLPPGAETTPEVAAQREHLAMALDEADAAGDFDRMLTLVDRNYGPALLVAWMADDRISREQVREHLAATWQMAEWPSQALDRKTWITLFRWTGYVSDPPGLPQSTVSVRLFRGCTPGRCRGMAWTSELDKARWFARRFVDVPGQRRTTAVFTALIEPAYVLARCNGREGEQEYVVDTLALPRGRIHRYEWCPPSTH